MVFHNEGKPIIEVPLPDVSTATVNKNEVAVSTLIGSFTIASLDIVNLAD